MAVIQSYFDDSKDRDGRVWLLAGFAGYANQWNMFERDWAALHDRHGVPYFHMKEMARPRGVFAKWYPPEKHQEEVTAYFKDIVKAIRDPYLHLFASAVYLRDLERFNAEYALDLKPYSLAAYACLAELAIHYGDVPITAVFDHCEKIDDKLATARRYAGCDRIPALTAKIISTPLPPQLTCRDVPALQAADFAAWESRRAHMSIEPFATTARHPLGKTRDEQWDDFKEWCRQQHGRSYPLQRKSFDALIEGRMPMEFVCWDYIQLCDMHKFRNGIWVPPDVRK